MFLPFLFREGGLYVCECEIKKESLPVVPIHHTQTGAQMFIATEQGFFDEGSKLLIIPRHFFERAGFVRKKLNRLNFEENKLIWIQDHKKEQTVRYKIIKLKNGPKSLVCQVEKQEGEGHEENSSEVI